MAEQTYQTSDSQPGADKTRSMRVKHGAVLITMDHERREIRAELLGGFSNVYPMSTWAKLTPNMTDAIDVATLALGPVRAYHNRLAAPACPASSLS